ncbi:MAG: hypothetical protein QXJ23_10695, partial [Thermofilum sp.]
GGKPPALAISLRVRNGGWRERSPHPGGVGGAPQVLSKGGKPPASAIGLRVENGGWRGAKPPSQRDWGCPPGFFQKGANPQHWQSACEWDPKPWQTLSPRGWEKGVQGA